MIITLEKLIDMEDIQMRQAKDEYVQYPLFKSFNGTITNYIDQVISALVNLGYVEESLPITVLSLGTSQAAYSAILVWEMKRRYPQCNIRVKILRKDGEVDHHSHGWENELGAVGEDIIIVIDDLISSGKTLATEVRLLHKHCNPSLGIIWSIYNNIYLGIFIITI